MPLAPGSRLGPYEIVAPIGAGGMGEVYKARDTRLERTVAVKVLPAQLSSSADSRQRFEREAKTISQLSHPHICALYDVGREGETEYLVMEYLEGETLTERLAKGALPLEQTLRYGHEIADALDKAHRQGIVHRDLKPGNVMITKSGVKLLDFGLAKAMAPATPQSGLTSMPTQQGLTQEGTILGTFQYMAPEQLEGREADARTDIFAFGAVLYEMVTGRKAFAGSSQASLISSIMKEDPAPISAVQPMSPPALDRVVRTCLAKDPEDRWQSARDVGNELRWIAEGSQAGVPTKVALRRKGRERAAWALAALAGAAAVALAVAYARRAPRAASPVRAQLDLPKKTQTADIALSPDGKRLAFTVFDAAGQVSLWIRDLDADAAQPVSGTESARFPFWSPDSRTVAFFADGKLKKREPDGTAILKICDAAGGVGGTWNRDGTIVFAPSPTSGLFRVSAAGGKPEAVTKLDAARHEVAHRYPSFLPDGRHFLYTSTSLGAADDLANAIHVASLDGKEDKTILPVFSDAQYAAGRLLYVRDDALVAQRFDVRRLAVEGDPVVLEARATRTTDWGGFYAFSASDDVLAVVPPNFVLSRLTWFDRSGRAAGEVGEPAVYVTYRLSPDERTIAAMVLDPARIKAGIVTIDAASGAATRFLRGAGNALYPVWSPDGSRLFFGSVAEGSNIPAIWSKALNGAKDEPYLEGPDNVTPWDWSRDGRFLAIEKVPLHGKRYNELWIVDSADRGHPIPFATENPNQVDARFSPDGKWIAYTSDESGLSEVYVRPFPGPGGTWQVTTAGGFAPHWRDDGKELFFLSPDNKIMAVPTSLGPTFQAGAPVALFTAHPGQANSLFEVSRDGQRFLVNTAPEQAASPPIHLLLNWTALAEKK